MQKQALEEAAREDEENKKMIARLKNERQRLLNSSGETTELDQLQEENRKLIDELYQAQKLREKLETLMKENSELRYDFASPFFVTNLRKRSIS